MSALDRFRGPDLERLREAVAAAEKRTSGEIAIYVVGECDPYPEAAWRASSLGAVLGLFGAVFWHLTSERWGYWGLPGGIWSAVVAPALLGAVLLGVGAPRVDILRRLFLSSDVVARRVGIRAQSAFLEEQVFLTRERTGVLLFLALFERRAVVLGDCGIAACVEQNEWNVIIEHLVAGMRRGELLVALSGAIDECGALLERHAVEIRVDDRNELPNEPRIREN